MRVHGRGRRGRPQGLVAFEVSPLSTVSGHVSLFPRRRGGTRPLSTTAIEEDQGEPITTFYTYLGRSAVLVDSSWTVPPECRGGWLYIGLGSLRSQLVRGAVLQVCDANRTPFVVADSSIEHLYQKKGIWIRWTRHNDFTPCDDPAKLFERVAENDPLVRQFCWRKWKRAVLDITGVLMREEVARGRQANTWLFVLREASQRRSAEGYPGPTRG